MKLGLGTVQFGLDYGVSNQDGRTPESEVAAILSWAAKQGISIVDTASQYGESEEILGRCLPEDQSFRIVTKTPSFRKRTIIDEDVLLLKKAFFASLRKLGQERISGLLMHHTDDLFSEDGPRLWRAMQELKDSGAVEKIGVSVYSPAQLDAALAIANIDLVQLPVNVLDQRMIQTGILKRLKDLHVEVHTRSVFLQGLLLMDPAELPNHFLPVKGHLIRYHEFLLSANISPLTAALKFVSDIEEIDALIVGINTLRHLKEIVSALDTPGHTADPDLEQFATTIPSIIDPSLWRLQ